MFETQQAFVDSVRRAVASTEPQKRAESTLREALAEWQGPPSWFGAPTAAEISVLHADADITIMHIVWPPHLITEPHNHNMWATIALYEGRENNIFWARQRDSIVPVGAETVCSGEVFSLASDVIHSVHNPVGKYTAAIHVYGGDLMATPRSEWDPENLVERPRDMDAAQRAFDQADGTD